MKKILVNGAGGFIGGHLVKRLKSEGHWVRAADLKRHEYATSLADEFIVGDLRNQRFVSEVVDGIDEVYQLAADMGGAGYIFTGEHDADVMHNSATINLNTLHYGVKAGVKKFFYSSSACIYPEYNQMDPNNPKCSEESAYPAAPDSEYGGKTLQRAPVPLLHAQLSGRSPRRPLSQHLRATRHLDRRQRESPGRCLPQSRRGGRRRRNRNLGRWKPDPIFPLHRRVP